MAMAVGGKEQLRNRAIKQYRNLSMKKVFVLIIGLLLSGFLFAQKDSSLVDSRDGKVYKTVKIGTQTWMAENLNYTTVNSWCYNDSGSYCKIYGRLYTWAAAKTACPAGWHLPSDADWSTLETYCGDEDLAGGVLKADTLWQKPNKVAAKGNGFSALPGGCRTDEAKFSYIGINGFWWESTEFSTDKAWAVYLNSKSSSMIRGNSGKKTNGLAVRCIKWK